MAAILNLIYCWLSEFWLYVNDFALGLYDDLLAVATAMLETLTPVDFTFPEIADQYAWIFGALGLSQFFTIIIAAWSIRFILQMIPFVRWGS